MTRTASHAVHFDVSGVGLRIRGLDPAVYEQWIVDRYWAPFVVDTLEQTWLDITVARVDGAPPRGPFAPHAMELSIGETEALFRMPEGQARLDQSGRVDVQLVGGIGKRAYYTLQNLIRASLAWRLPSRGGALLHAAGLVLDGRAFLLVGPAGAGKTSWAQLGAEAGLPVLSDDLVLLDSENGGTVVLGAPFRSTRLELSGPGRWPLGGFLFPERGTAPVLLPAGQLRSRAQLLANLPFIVQSFGQDPRLSALLTRWVANTRCAVLRFELNPGFIEPLRRWARDG